MNVEYVFGVSIISLTTQSLADIIALSTITSNEGGRGNYILCCVRSVRECGNFFSNLPPNFTDIVMRG